MFKKVDMTWGLTEEHTYKTNLETEDMINHLRTIVDTQKKLKKNLGRIQNKIHKPYYGFVRQTTFDFFNNPSLWNDSSIQITGTIHQTNSDSVRKVSIKITPVNNLVPSLLGITFCIFPMVSLLTMTDLKTIILSFLFPIFGLGIIFLPFKINYVETRDRLENLLQLKDLQ
jgi:hypothetical protein